ncbi:SpaA isopeptide-forming pilin-related protein [Olsenella porci]|nr:SpaA isopeptide-forming pilin-related protein [Olsenella porci]
MKKGKNLARIAVTAGLTMAMTLGGVALPATAAFAATTGNVTIQKNANNNADETTTLGYQIFTGDVVDSGTSKTVSNIKWASDEVESVVVTQITALDGSYKGTSAQDAADYLSTHLPAEGSSGTSTIIESNKLYSNIANALRADTKLTPTKLAAGTASSLSAGYWLFLTDATSTANTDSESKVDQVGSAPIYAVVGDGDLTVSPKSTLPTVNKEVKNDAVGSDWGKVADSQVGQDLQYRLTGTVADAIPSYDTYYYKFTDTLSAGLTADKSSVAVTVVTNGTTYTVASDSYSTTLVTNSDNTSTLGVEFNDLKTIKDSKDPTATIPVNGSSKVYVTYNAKLDTSKAYKVASERNDNSVKLTYSNNPGTDSKGDSTPSTVGDYTFKLKMDKVDSSDGSKTLKGAKFTIQATGADEVADEGAGTQYVQKDGTLGSDPYEFTTTTDANGYASIYVSGLDVGKYTVVETQAPSGYNTVAKFDFEIRATYDNTGTITKVEASSSNGNAADASTDKTGLVTVTVKDKAGMGLPLTGQAGVTATWIAGGIVLAIGVTHLVRSRREGGSEE